MIIFRPFGDIFSISAKISVKRPGNPTLAALDKGVNRTVLLRTIQERLRSSCEVRKASRFALWGEEVNRDGLPTWDQ
jgi:hypothetical protein